MRKAHLSTFQNTLKTEYRIIIDQTMYVYYTSSKWSKGRDVYSKQEKKGAEITGAIVRVIEQQLQVSNYDPSRSIEFEVLTSFITVRDAK
jgi:hypothetical protein